MKLLRRSTALLLSCAIVLGLVASGFLIRAIADTAMQWYNADYDALSRFYEIGASYDPGIIATTPGDPGGKSYGMYMFASNAGVPHDFAEWCKKSDKSVYRDIGDALDSAYHRISDGYGSYFDATWQDMANTYKGTFGQAQYDYTKDKFYNKVVSLVENKVDGFDIEEYSVALKNVFWSRAVQHGPTDACSLIKRAFDSLGGFANQPEGDLISAIYAVSGRLVTAEELRSEGKSGAAMSGDTANKYGTSGLILRYFYGSSGDVQMGVYTCKSCGGELVCDESTAATACPFCGNPIVLTGRLSGDLKPDYVIPFKLDKKAAEAALRNHMKGKRLLPNLFRSENRISEVKGVYVPFWLFDADADAHIRYHATRIRTWSDRDYDYTETQHYAILRSGDLSFTHVPVDGSSRMPNDLMESIEPFDFSSAVDFQTAYLSGYLADRYDVNADDSIGRANERVKKSTESVFASTVVGYHTVVPESTSVRLANGRVRYALYPVWLLNTVWNGKTFSFAMNGQTGKFVGDLPVDKGKKWRWFGLVSGIAAAAAYGLVCLWQLLH